MLQITVPAIEYWDEKNEEFIVGKEQTLQLEHSLVSLSKWESKWHKSFIHRFDDESHEETTDYIKCMTITQNVDPEVYERLSPENIQQIKDYINNPMTATCLPNENSSKNSSKKSGDIVTSELIYYWMITLNIPVEFQKWHLNKLLALIGVCNVKNKPPKKRSKREIMKESAAINAARRNQLKAKG